MQANELNTMNIIKSETNFEIPPISFAQYLSTEIQRTDKDAIALVKISQQV